MDSDPPGNSNNLSTAPSRNAEQVRQPRAGVRSPAASLIQSAARSVLDDLTPSTIVSDDVSDDESESCCADGALGLLKPSGSPTLRSLQKKIPPALPDEQDRRRFIGCLAAVLASTYEYEEPDENEKKSGTGEFRYLDHTEELFDAIGAEEEDEEDMIPRASSSLSDTESYAADRTSSFECNTAASCILWCTNTSTFCPFCLPCSRTMPALIVPPP